MQMHWVGQSNYVNSLPNCEHFKCSCCGLDNLFQGFWCGLFPTRFMLTEAGNTSLSCSSSPPWDPGHPLTVSGTDLSFHVWSDGNGGPDGRVDAKKHQPDEHASPDGQVTELQEETDAHQQGHLRAWEPPDQPCPTVGALGPCHFSLWKGFYESLVIGEFDLSHFLVSEYLMVNLSN